MTRFFLLGLALVGLCGAARAEMAYPLRNAAFGTPYLVVQFNVTAKAADGFDGPSALVTVRKAGNEPEHYTVAMASDGISYQTLLTAFQIRQPVSLETDKRGNLIKVRLTR